MERNFVKYSISVSNLYIPSSKRLRRLTMVSSADRRTQLSSSLLSSTSSGNIALWVGSRLHVCRRKTGNINEMFEYTKEGMLFLLVTRSCLPPTAVPEVTQWHRHVGYFWFTRRRGQAYILAGGGSQIPVLPQKSVSFTQTICQRKTFHLNFKGGEGLQSLWLYVYAQWLTGHRPGSLGEVDVEYKNPELWKTPCSHFRQNIKLS